MKYTRFDIAIRTNQAHAQVIVVTRLCERKNYDCRFVHTKHCPILGVMKYSHYACVLIRMGERTCVGSVIEFKKMKRKELLLIEREPPYTLRCSFHVYRLVLIRW